MEARRLLCHVSLRSTDSACEKFFFKSENDLGKEFMVNLIGDQVSTGDILLDPIDNESKLFFTFTNLSIRLMGKYSLDCKVYDLDRS